MVVLEETESVVWMGIYPILFPPENQLYENPLDPTRIMEDPERSSQTLNNQHRHLSGKRRRKHGSGGDGGSSDEECDPELWKTLNEGFKEVQSVLDQNRRLIQQVNDNQRSKDPENLVQNVALIHEINGNVSKVRGIYSNLAVNFSNIVGEKRSSGGKSVIPATASSPPPGGLSGEVFSNFR